MSIFDNLGNWLGAHIAPYVNDAMTGRNGVLAAYYTGDHRKQLKPTLSKDGITMIDDNIIENFTGLVVNRSISRMFRGGLKFILPEGAEAQQEYLDSVWDLNKKEILLFQYALNGSWSGTAYMKILPEGIQEPYTLNWYPRLKAIDPRIIRVKTRPSDEDEVEEYKIEYTYVEMRNGRDVTITHREITRHSDEEDYITGNSGEQVDQTPDTWVIEEWEQVGGAPWQLIQSILWEYSFPPIIHQKNLPSIGSCYGTSDDEDVINLQDKTNFTASNTGKIIKFFASPKTFIFGVSPAVLKEGAIDSATGTIYAIPNTEGSVENLEMQSDLASSRLFHLDLRQSIFDISREVDITSMADKLGALTNFGLQVLWSDAIDKNDTKRQLYGDALLDINRRLLVLAGFEGEQSKPGTVQWGNPLPVNIIEEMTADEKALGLGVIDKETVAKRYEARYGVDWDTIKANIEKEKSDDNANNNNIGAAILRSYNQGQGVNELQGVNAQPNNNPRR